jgi:hypothetical protein
MKRLSRRFTVALLTLAVGLLANGLRLKLSEPSEGIEPPTRYYWISSGDPINYEREGMVLVSEEQYRYAMQWREFYKKDPH